METRNQKLETRRGPGLVSGFWFLVSSFRLRPSPFSLLPFAFWSLVSGFWFPQPAFCLPPQTLGDVRAVRTNNQLDLYESGLKTLTQSSDPRTRGRALALLALFYVDQKRTNEALPLLGQAADADPLVAPWLRLRI